MKKSFKHSKLFDELLAEPEKYLQPSDASHENECFRMIEIRNLPDGHVSVQAVLIQPPMRS